MKSAMRKVWILAVAGLVGCGSPGDADRAGNNGSGGHDTPAPDNNAEPDNNGGPDSDDGYNIDEQSVNNSTNGNGYAPVEPAPANQGENYEALTENDFVATADQATSTFSIDVDNASYTLMRRDLQSGALPHPDGVRVEEYVNFFDYDYVEPSGDSPFSINLEVAPSAFGQNLHMLRVGLKGRAITREEMRPANLVFLVDVSGSMSEEMPLVKYALTTLTNSLRPTDSIAIVTYAGDTGTLLEPTTVSEASDILAAIAGMQSGGSTYGEGGIVAAYEVAEAARIDGGINRVVLVTDGDFNVGLSGQPLRDLVEAKRQLQIGLTVAGIGSGNFNDADLEAFARTSNGNYFYIDGEEEADRIFGTEVTSTLEVIAADVKIQVAFDPAAVVRYRLVGYENRLLANEDFEDDTKDAGEIGPGHTVTALYEIELADETAASSGFVAEVSLRHKAQFGVESTKQVQNIKRSQVKATLADASPDLQFAMAVTEFAEILRGSMHTDGSGLDTVETMATANAGADAKRLEFLELLDLARPLLSAP